MKVYIVTRHYSPSAGVVIADIVGVFANKDQAQSFKDKQPKIVDVPDYAEKRCSCVYSLETRELMEA